MATFSAGRARIKRVDGLHFADGQYELFDSGNAAVKIPGWLVMVAVVVTLPDVQPVAAAGYGAPWVGVQFDGAPCRGGMGTRPRDYTNRAPYLDQLGVNERFHFTPNVENLISGENGSIPGDIDFMLRAWPNHHRALNSISRYQMRITRNQPKTLAAVECYFQRAINFSPNDSVSMLLYAIYLHKTDHLEEALSEYNNAMKLSPNDAQIQYNLALLLVDMEDYDEALEYAQKVYSEGFPLPGLKRRLTEAGYWPAGAGEVTN